MLLELSDMSGGVFTIEAPVSFGRDLNKKRMLQC